MKNTLTHIPFSSPWIIRHFLNQARTVLDVGCGDGSLMLKVNYDKKYEVTGIDLYKPSLKKALKTGVYKKIIHSDLRKTKIESKSFDVVLASQVIEHISKKDGLKLMKVMEKIARDRIIIYTPKGFVPFDPFEVKDKNPLQEHKSGWEIDEMKRNGYKVYGQGLGVIYYPGSGLIYKYKKLKKVLEVFSYMLSPLTYFFPKIASMIIAVKE